MLYIKSYAFIKRTCLLLSPLFLVTLASKELAFYSPAATLSPMLGDSDVAKDSIITLASHLHQDLPEGIEDYGNLKIQKNWFGDLWIEETNSLSTFSHNTDYKFKDAKDLIKPQENRYVLKQEDFEKAVKDKGDINVLITFQLSTDYLEPIQITHIVPLIDLTTATTKEYTVVSTKVEADDQKRDHALRVQKDESKQEISFQLVSDISNAKLAIDSFYFLFNDNPPLNPKAYFSTLGSLPDLVGDISNGRVKKVFLNKWSNKKPTEPTYEFKTDNGFWKSACSDPYRVGGFIDEDLKVADSKKQQAAAEQKKLNSEEKTKIKRQMKSYVEFRANEKEVEKRTDQYFWRQIKGVNAYVPHDEYTETWKPNCQGLDPETKNKFKEHLNKVLERELKPRINSEIAPLALIKEVKNGEVSTNSQTSEYPYHKIVQSSFRAWGNTYLTKEGENAKDAGKYSKPFELSNQSEHTFSIKIDRKTWTKFLTQKRLENLNKSQDISSLIEVYYPISFSFFDPISSHLRKHSLLLKTELDLSKLYEHSSYSKEVYRFDIGRNNSEIGKDYQGFEIWKKDKEKPYGLDGLLSFVSKLELDKSKDLNISLTAKVNGFVNTKNPSCDLRHRVYKIKGAENWDNLDENLKCSTDTNWSYRKHIHIPSYLVLSLDREPEVSSFYIDRQSGVTEQSEEEANSGDTSKPIKTLSELADRLESKEIVKVVETNESNKAEVYFSDIETYENRKDDVGFFHDTSSWWGGGSQNIYYWHPKRAYGTISDVDFNNLSSITLKLDGSKHSHSAFFHSNHFNTLTTLCLSDKYTIPPSPPSKEKDCADGINYDKEEKDTTSSKLPDLWGSQKLVIDLSQNQLKDKTDESKAVEVKFRVTYNRANRKESSEAQDKDDFQKIKQKLEKFFKGDEKNEPKSSEIPEASMLAFWYSIFFWKAENENKLHYATQVRPIGLITKQISNSTSHYASGAAGSAGFEISKFEFRYTSPSPEAA